MIAAASGCCLRPLGIVLNEPMGPINFYLTANHDIEQQMLFSDCFRFIHYDPLGSSSDGCGGDYPRSGSALKKLPALPVD